MEMTYSILGLIFSITLISMDAEWSIFFAFNFKVDEWYLQRNISSEVDSTIDYFIRLVDRFSSLDK